ncbi:YkvA family protein [Streptococcus suis]|uniref:DUF1232 domain-containing protein n=2 Tax=Streptococcus suis TaxID=1307 RepID=A0AAD0PA20_STRSU|nr:DUF1232 domain-containing protein [Streptococcus suis]AWX95606.1 hypothetical protein BKM66_05440 [Streptococcus suis]AWX97555.1 hypothetical protein BKM67_05725 [Streptococcus suis]MCL4943357.1 DUF1232 domain-containing protein [Streptococcus suis]MDG4480685.1 DUF1232 domain-containing protein [Streptococcus suis]MDG4486942.1 DUF1232 domain-containing protein [Streptococcus suis]
MLEEIQKGFKKAESLLKDDAKMEPFLEKLDKKIKWVHFVGDEIKSFPIPISMVRSYWKKFYTCVPTRSIIAIISSLIFFLSPIDVVPDFWGHLDDVLVIATVWKQVHKDIDWYRE